MFTLKVGDRVRVDDMDFQVKGSGKFIGLEKPTNKCSHMAIRLFHGDKVALPGGKVQTVGHLLAFVA